MGMHVDSTITKEVTLDVEVEVEEVTLFGTSVDFKVNEVVDKWCSDKDDVRLIIEIDNSPEYLLTYFDVDDIVTFLQEKGYTVTN